VDLDRSKVKNRDHLKIVEKRGVFFITPRVDAKTPPSPRISPHLHHQNTTAKPAISQKTPAKTTKHHTKKIHSNPRKPRAPISDLSTVMIPDFRQFGIEGEVGIGG
jgi:hypothetical protein